jgi:hypothetical protein
MWSAAADASWISLAAEPAGQGDASIPYSVAPNPVPAARSGTITVGSEKVQLSQAAAPCTFRLSKPSDSIDAGGGRLSVELNTLTGCSWSAASDAAWLTIVGGTSGTASGTITVEAGANSGEARVAHVNAGGQTYTVAQAAKPATAGPPPAPVPSPPPPPQSPPPPSGNSITLDGVVLAVLGHCPDIAFWTDSHWAVATAATDYKKGRCEDVSTGDSVKVNGRLRADDAVDADSVELKKQR